MAFLMVPMRSLGQDNWKVASALMGSYIGGGKWFKNATMILDAIFLDNIQPQLSVKHLVLALLGGLEPL